MKSRSDTAPDARSQHRDDIAKFLQEKVREAIKANYTAAQEGETWKLVRKPGTEALPLLSDTTADELKGIAIKAGFADNDATLHYAGYLAEPLAMTGGGAGTSKRAGQLDRLETALQPLVTHTFPAKDAIIPTILGQLAATCESLAADATKGLPGFINNTQIFLKSFSEGNFFGDNKQAALATENPLETWKADFTQRKSTVSGKGGDTRFGSELFNDQRVARLKSITYIQENPDTATSVREALTIALVEKGQIVLPGHLHVLLKEENALSTRLTEAATTNGNKLTKENIDTIVAEPAVQQYLTETNLAYLTRTIDYLYTEAVEQCGTFPDTAGLIPALETHRKKLPKEVSAALDDFDSHAIGTEELARIIKKHRDTLPNTTTVNAFLDGYDKGRTTLEQMTKAANFAVTQLPEAQKQGMRQFLSTKANTLYASTERDVTASQEHLQQITNRKTGWFSSTPSIEPSLATLDRHRARLERITELVAHKKEDQATGGYYDFLTMSLQEVGKRIAALQNNPTSKDAIATVPHLAAALKALAEVGQPLCNYGAHSDIDNRIKTARGHLGKAGITIPEQGAARQPEQKLPSNFSSISLPAIPSGITLGSDEPDSSNSHTNRLTKTAQATAALQQCAGAIATQNEKGTPIQKDGSPLAQSIAALQKRLAEISAPTNPTPEVSYGIGAKVERLQNGTFRVIEAPGRDTKAHAAGLKEGSIITQVKHNGRLTNVTNLSEQDFITAFRQEAGKKVEFSFKENAASREQPASITTDIHRYHENQPTQKYDFGDAQLNYDLRLDAAVQKLMPQSQRAMR